ncbi:hypothetical protein OAU17_03190 [Acidimicrobiia bacterium]|nr:hypothetical protein [Acidimicrobiia bacterium]
MKVSIGTNIKDGPWGGGNLFAINLSNFLINNGIEVVYNLIDEDIDVILITEPRKTSESSSFTHLDVENYVKYINPKSVVIHRINECDERKNTNYVNKYLIYANRIADETIFVSSWLKNIYLDQGIDSKVNHVVYAGANKKVFNSINFKPWVKGEKIKITTHHWGANWNKGFESYLKIDELIGTSKWSDILEFTYIGNTPKKLEFNNSKTIAPLSGVALANEIKKHNLYITGSINEPSGNHHIEASQCGLPILYINSGGIPEYCQGYGLKYEFANLEKKLEEIIANYGQYAEAIKVYPNNSDEMSRQFLDIFNDAIKKKDMYSEERLKNLKQNPLSKTFYKFKRNYFNQRL